jgi:ribulose-5-phosphate 4-epimerase/fuculose-1-phosphate aldolase
LPMMSCPPPEPDAQDPTISGPGLVVKTAAEAIDQLVIANRIIANEGVVDALGHVSIRNPENPSTFFISRVLAPIEVTRKDIVEVDLEGKVISKPAQNPPGEMFIHSAILQARPEMNAVFHGHPLSIIPFTVTDIPLRPLLNTAGFLHQGVPVLEDYTPGSGLLIGTREEGERVARHLGPHRVQLLRSHGCNIVAESLPRVVACAIYLNINATIQWQTLLLGQEPKYLSPQEAKPGGDIALFQDSAMRRFWGHWSARVRYAMPDMK